MTFTVVKEVFEGNENVELSKINNSVENIEVKASQFVI
jgi:hypothetical protein